MIEASEREDVPKSSKLVRLTVDFGDLLDLGYADGITPALAVPERELPNGARAG